MQIHRFCWAHLGNEWQWHKMSVVSMRHGPHNRELVELQQHVHQKVTLQYWICFDGSTCNPIVSVVKHFSSGGLQQLRVLDCDCENKPKASNFVTWDRTQQTLGSFAWVLHIPERGGTEIQRIQLWRCIPCQCSNCSDGLVHTGSKYEAWPGWSSTSCEEILIPRYSWIEMD